MVAIAYSYLRDRHLAEDAAQQVFAKAFYSISRLKNPEGFTSWLVTICRNVASDMLKASPKEKSCPIEDLASIKDQSAQRNEPVETIRNIIFQLPDGVRQVVFLRYYNKMSYDQIAKALRISKMAVNGKLKRAKKKIANKLLQKYPDRFL
jgi:RNA polymerase sigma-70 factor (ECF subfamily)